MLITAEALRKRVESMATEIAGAYEGDPDGITLVTVLAGAIIFVSDLIRRLPIKLRIGLIGVSSYAGATTVSRGARIESIILPDLRNRNVLIVDDILDTGGTLRLVQAHVRSAGPSSMRTAVLLRKAGKAPADVEVDYVGFDIEDVFVVGYGLDYDGLHRNLPHIAVLESVHNGIGPV